MCEADELTREKDDMKQIFEVWRAPEAEPTSAKALEAWLNRYRDDSEWQVNEMAECRTHGLHRKETVCPKCRSPLGINKENKGRE